MIILSVFLTVINIFYKFLILLFVYNILLPVKLILLILSLSLYYYIYTYPKRQRLTLSGLRRWKMRFPLEYKLVSKKDHLINIGVLVIYVLIFIVGLLWLRFHNSNRVVDLTVYYHTLYNIIKLAPISHFIVNVLLLLAMFLLFRTLMSTIMKYVRHQLIVRHLYLYGNEYYTNLLFNIHSTNILDILESKIRLLCDKLNLRKYPTFLPFPLDYYTFVRYKNKAISCEYDTPLQKVINKILLYLENNSYIIHRRISFIVIAYDILFNDFILTHMYKILPYVFLYEILVKVKTFLGERIYGLGDPDTTIHGILYKPGYETMGELFVIDGKFYDKSLIAEIVVYYVYNDFRDIHHKWTYDDERYKKKKVSLIQRLKILHNKIQKELNVYTKHSLMIILIVQVILIISNHVIS